MTVIISGNGPAAFPDANGNLGLGTTTPTAKLQISSPGGWSAFNYGKGLYVTTTGGAANPAIGISDYTGSNNWGIINASGKLFFSTMPAITDSSSSTTTRIVVDTSGNLGIGTESPGSKLDIISESAGDGSRITNYMGSSATGLFLTLRTARGTVASPSAVQVGDRIGAIGMGGSTTGSAFYNSALITSYIDSGTVSATSLPTYMSFWTTPDGTLSRTERMRIDSSGNVGIGTVSPAAKLDIGSGNLNFSGTAQRITGDFSNATLANRVAFQSSTVNSNTGIFIIPNGTATTANFQVSNASNPINSSVGIFGVSGSTDVRIQSAIQGTGTYLPMTFYAGGSEAMRIDSSGNIGIGTSSPGNKLDVAGNQGFTTAAYVFSYAGGTSAQVRSGIQLDGTNQQMLFFTGTNERMRIDSSGRVGIGTNSPNSKLQVYNPSYSAFTGSSLGGILITDTNGTNNYYSSIDFNTNSNGALPLARIAMKYTSAGSHLVFGTSNNYANGITNTAMTIDYAGNVGIGTTSPIRTLNVNGSVASSVGNVEMSLTAAATTGTAFINVSDNVGSNGSGWSLEIRGLATSGSASTNLATVSVSATNTYFNGNVNPGTTNSYDLGSSSYRWRNIYTQDLHLSNGIGDYTVVEGEEDLFLVNNKSGKTFKFALIEVDPSTIPPKSET